MSYHYDHNKLTLLQKFYHINLSLLIVSFITVFIGTIMLYGTADASFTPWAGAHIGRYMVGVGLCVFISILPIEWIYRIAYFVHIVAILLLIATELVGDVSKGAQRWLNLGFIRLQPSEFAKITTLMALARFFHESYRYRLLPVYMIGISLLIIFIPAILVLKQPDLGTALLLIFGGVTVMFGSGIHLRVFIISGIGIIASLPLIWFSLHQYQRQRVLTFLDPESDPLGAGYHISQAKIAMGSGGITGRGYMQGPQSMLEFLPEKHTDFAFTAFAEQFGFIGSIFLLLCLGAIIFIMLRMALRCKHIFGKLLILGIATNFFFYVFINMGMVMGILPVVGVPLPFISYGGTVMMTIMIGFGLAQNSFIHDDLLSDDF
jgi:rod shape determining protein RodA